MLIADMWLQELAGVSPYDGKSPSGRSAQLNRIEAGLAAVLARRADAAARPELPVPADG